MDFEHLRTTSAEFVPTVQHAEDTSNFDTFEVNAEELFRENYSGPNSAYNPAFFDFTFRHFFANDGAQKLNHIRAPQRPKLATLLESQPSSSGVQSPTNSEKRSSRHLEAQYKSNTLKQNDDKQLEQSRSPVSSPFRPNKHPAPTMEPATTHPIFNRKLQKHNLTNTNNGLPMALHSAFTNGLPHLAYNTRPYEKQGEDTNV